MIQIVMPFDKNRKKDKDRAYKRIMWLFKEYQRTNDKQTYLSEIQKIVNEMDMRFYIEFRVHGEQHPYRVMFVPDRMKGIR